MKAIKFFLIVFIFLHGEFVLADNYDLFSPDKRTYVKIIVDKNISFSVLYNNIVLVKSATLSMNIMDDIILGKNPKINKIKRNSVNEIIYPVVWEKRKEIPDIYEQIDIKFKDGYSVIFRAYNDGVAYRFVTGLKDEITVNSEEFAVHFPYDEKIYFPEEESFLTHSERLYKHIKLSEITEKRMSCMPAIIDYKNGTKLIITESDLESYPGLYLSGSSDGSAGIFGKFPPYPLEEIQTRDRTVEVKRAAEYIAKTKGTRSFPWRIFAIAEKDSDIPVNDIVYRLGPDGKLDDPSWIKPGKVSWDWWNALNIEGVDFESGVNTATYKYYIDFAAKYGIEYIILDEGWSAPEDIFKINPDVDIDELFNYSQKKNVGIILWVVWKSLDNDLEKALNKFEQWGAKGIKVDFMQRDDQIMVEYYYKVAEEAAKRHLLVDFHGSYKPAGLRKAYPNVITREGIKGLENSKWGEEITPEHNVTIPFTRMFAGPMDYTPGAMRNAQKENFKPFFTRPMSMGTRCHQLAMYVIYESPLQMLCDAPSNYYKEPEIMEFLSVVPTVWEETIIPEAKIGDYIMTVRKSGDEWYVGAMTDWSSRDMILDLSFLEKGEYIIEIWQDGINSDRIATDYKKITKTIKSGESINIHLAKGGGWAARIYQ
ncbi:glycoside hydrolase family 97 protein [Bacteroidota bacterium]